MRALPRWTAITSLILIGLALVWSVPAAQQFQANEQVRQARISKSTHAKHRDLDLYEDINARVSKGESYYTAALAEQRKWNYPTQPFVVVRLPTLAWGHALFGATGWRIIAIALFIANLLVWTRRFRSPRHPLLSLIVIGGLLTLGGGLAFYPRVGVVHDYMSGLFVSLSLVLYTPQRWWPSLCLAVCAMAIREMASLYVLAWVALAAARMRWRECGALLAALALFALGMAVHAHFVDAAVKPGDLVSPGWEGMNGLGFLLFSLAHLFPHALPLWCVAWLGLAALIGWIGRGERIGLMGSLWLGGFGLAVAIFARADNYYWVAIMLPAYWVGLAFAPRALIDLWQAARLPGWSANRFMRQ
ncbi:hypothetical protein D6851_06305 [Altericroceibacterium spongiae]|uniref:Uncharacterized protein n=1 Tax=Altericroceibacterium spongiae TaxID=2320269 RepID=A0A420ELT8_9SPHN|nr:hypothetical protein D6851_06305 [Altericroceibacterium spongiae]